MRYSHKWQTFILLIAVSLLLWRCANQRPITGGPKDEIPPELQSSFPEDQSINYTEKSFELVFDEYVQADKIAKELIITPITEIRYETKVKKNTVILTFDSLLEANTTYILNFRNSIVDITERNPAENLRLAFSTGPILDSLSISGVVTDLMLGTPVKDASVLLYKATDTLTVNGGKPMYLVQTNDEGFFEVTNLKASEYQLFVLKEEDSNITYSKPQEQIGFLEQNIQLDSNQSNINIPLINYDILELKLQRVRTNKQYIDFTFNKTIDTFTIEALDKADQSSLKPVIKNEILRLFPPLEGVVKDSFDIRITASDSLGASIDSTLSIKFKETKRLEETAFEVTGKPSSGALLAKDTMLLALEFSKPVVSYTPDSAWMYTEEDTIPFIGNLQKEHTDTYWTFEFTPPALPYSLQFNRGSFISIEQDTLAPITLTYTPRLAEDYGIVTGKIETWKPSFIIQLLNNGKVEQEIRNKRDFQFTWVRPGARTLRILIDDDEDGIWEKGDFYQRVLPESIYFYPADIAVKANWEIELDPITF